MGFLYTRRMTIGLILGSGWTCEPDDQVQLIKRTHLYEGKGVEAVVSPIYEAHRQGIKTLILTNAAGSLTRQPGEIVLIKDHINLTATSPLDGFKFVDMSDTYSKRLRSLVQASQALPEGIYAQFRGPQYETPAEVQMAGILGADLVGMSTALEAIAARALGIEVIGLSLVTNWAAGIKPYTLDHSEVLAIAEMSKHRLHATLSQIIQLIKENPQP